jgi:hypothetical protein
MVYKWEQSTGVLTYQTMCYFVSVLRPELWAPFKFFRCLKFLKFHLIIPYYLTRFILFSYLDIIRDDFIFCIFMGIVPQIMQFLTKQNVKYTWDLEI